MSSREPMSNREQVEREHPGLWHQVAGQWKQFKGELRTTWGKITDDEWEEIGGQFEILVGKIQEHYGLAREEAEHQIDQFVSHLK